MPGDVVAVLVGEDEFAARAVGRRRLVAADDDLVLAAVVAGLGAEAAIEFHLGWRVELDSEQLHLGAVDQRAEEVRRSAAGRRPSQVARQAVVTAIATFRRCRRRSSSAAPQRWPRSAPSATLGTAITRVARPHLPARRGGEEEDHGYARKRPRRALAQGAGPGSIS